MPKALCLISLVASILIAVLFAADALFGLLGMADFAPWGATNLTMDIAFTVFALMLVFLSWTTYREQR